MTIHRPTFTQPIEDFDEKRRLFIRGMILGITPFLGGCAHRILQEEKPSKERTLEMLLSHEIVLNGKPEPMPSNISLEPIENSTNYRLINPNLALVTQDIIEISEYGHVITEQVKIRLKPFEFRAKVAASIYGLTEGDIYTIKNGAKQIIIEKK